MMFSRMVTKASAGAALAAALVLGSGAGAYAHECFNPSRSDQGDAKAAKSQAWDILVVDSAIQGDVPRFITQPQADCIKAAYKATGAPSSFTLMVKGAVGQDGVIAAHNPNTGLLGDGKGIDHLFAAYGEQIGGSYAACGVSI